MSERRTVTVRGPFTEAEMKRIIAVVGEIESARPTETFEVFIDAPSMEGDPDRIVEELNPLRPGYERIVRYRPR